MTKSRQLTRKQLAVIDDLFGGELDEQTVLDKHKVSRSVYNRWLADSSFAEQFDQRIASAHRRSQLIIARYASLATAKLVQLTDSENQETARKACLDIISLPRLAAERIGQPSETGVASRPQQLSQATASKLLAALAEEKNDEEME